MSKEKEIDTSKIDELYEMYCYSTSMESYNACLNALHSKEENGGGNVLIKNLVDYIEHNVKKVTSMYSSLQKEEQEKENIENIVYALKNIAVIVNYLLDDYDKIENERTGIKYSHRFVSMNDLFNFNFLTMQEAFAKYHEDVNISRQMFNKTIELLEFFKEKKSFQKVFGNNDWYNMPTNEVLLSLKDYHKQHVEKFNIGKIKDSFLKEMINRYSYGFFEKIKNNCDIDFVQFDKYRPGFISKHTMISEIDKLVFCKNLLEFYRTDLYVDRNGYLDCCVDCIPDYLVSKFRKLYNTKFDEKEFKSKQANIIFNPDFNYNYSKDFNKPHAILSMKNIQTDNGLVIGIILENYTGEIYYLLHIAIDDIHKNESSYEIQLNLLPQGDIDKRIQLIRMDNYETQQAHKNLGGKRLDTTTHVHLYNHFDLLRGKQNGNYDISHNREGESTDFYSALNDFLGVMEIDVELHNEILKKIKEIKKRREKQNKIGNFEI